ncbi:Aste57867_3215 [Aphanomyces stellatus]|uniref:Aste57867_3215 protein n=1 Tax=Aphanomyces stellatus TaxID=120398 RepID=A0A485KAX2_9STRA|nr:hypothetical protein As57867_003205 [Aphanomyces stellatus]VFT80389.1 Aste57867_3215 [Aphanomyces stellatus]
MRSLPHGPNVTVLVAHKVPTDYIAHAINLAFPVSWKVPNPYSKSEALALEDNLRQWLAPVLTSPAMLARFKAANVPGYGTSLEASTATTTGRSSSPSVALVTMWDDYIETAPDALAYVAHLRRMADCPCHNHCPVDSDAQPFLALWQDCLTLAAKWHRRDYTRFRCAFQA